jgi:hypothetical protein
MEPVRECRDTQTGGDMTPHIRENISTWLVDWSLVIVMGNTPPRDPNDDDDEDEGEEDEENEDQDEELPVVREPDE